MFAQDGNLHLHRPFLDRLAQKKPDAPCSLAAFLLLNVVDGLKHPDFDADALGLRINAAYNPLASMPERDPQVARLVNLAESLRRIMNTRRSVSMIPELLDYAEWLSSDSRHVESLEVLNSGGYVLEPTFLREEALLLRRRGHTLRHLGRYKDAEAAFQLGSQRALSCGDQQLSLRCRIGLAQVWTYQGRSPQSRKLLSTLVLEAMACSQNRERACAAHDLAIASRDCIQEALVLIGEAYHFYGDERLKRRAKSDLCYFLIEGGHFNSAFRCARSIRSDSEGLTFRAVALENELRIASYLGDRKSFYDTLRIIEGIDRSLAVSSYTDLKLRAGQGFLFFGDRELGKRNVSEALEIAVSNGYSATVAEALDSMRVIEGGAREDTLKIRPSREPVGEIIKRDRKGYLGEIMADSQVTA